MDEARHRQGFTLLEMLAVVVIIGLLASIVMPNLGVRESRALDDQVRGLANDLEFARQRTIMTGIRHRLLIDLDRGQYEIQWQQAEEEEAEDRYTDDGRIDLSPPTTAAAEFRPLDSTLGRAATLREGILFESVETADGLISSGEVTVGFERDGTADPTTIVLAYLDGDARILEVLPLADAVRIDDATF